MDFHHYKDLEEDLEEMAAVEGMVVEIQEETVAKEIVVQEDQTMEADTEVQEMVDKEIVAQEDQMKDLDTEGQGQDLLENLLETLQEHKVEQ